MVNTLTTFKNYQKVISQWLLTGEGIKPVNTPERDLLADLSQRKAALDARGRDLKTRMDESITKAKALLQKP